MQKSNKMICIDNLIVIITQFINGKRDKTITTYPNNPNTRNNKFINEHNDKLWKEIKQSQFKNDDMYRLTLNHYNESDFINIFKRKQEIEAWEWISDTKLTEILPYYTIYDRHCYNLMPIFLYFPTSGNYKKQEVSNFKMKEWADYNYKIKSNKYDKFEINFNGTEFYRNNKNHLFYSRMDVVQQFKTMLDLTKPVQISIFWVLDTLTYQILPNNIFGKNEFILTLESNEQNKIQNYS